MSNQVLSHLMEEERKIEERKNAATGGKWWWHREAGLLLGLKSTRISPWKWIVTWKGADAPREGFDVSREDMALIAHAKDDIDTLLSTINALRERVEAAEGWVACAERMPGTDEIIVVAYDADWKAQFWACWDGEKWEPSDDREPPENVTHWRPLPAPPERLTAAEGRPIAMPNGESIGDCPRCEAPDGEPHVEWCLLRIEKDLRAELQRIKAVLRERQWNERGYCIVGCNSHMSVGTRRHVPYCWYAALLTEAPAGEDTK